MRQKRPGRLPVAKSWLRRASPGQRSWPSASPRTMGYEAEAMTGDGKPSARFFLPLAWNFKKSVVALKAQRCKNRNFERFLN